MGDVHRCRAIVFTAAFLVTLAMCGHGQDLETGDAAWSGEWAAVLPSESVGVHVVSHPEAGVYLSARAAPNDLPKLIGAGFGSEGEPFLARFDTEGRLVWTRCLEYGGVVCAVDQAGNAILGGSARDERLAKSEDGYTGQPPRALKELTEPPGKRLGQHALLLSYDPEGKLLWTKRFGGIEDEITDIEILDDGAMVASGSLDRHQYYEGRQSFIALVDADLALKWWKPVQEERSWLSGSSPSNFASAAGAHIAYLDLLSRRRIQYRDSGRFDAAESYAMVRLDRAGEVLRSTPFAITEWDYDYRLALDRSGAAYILGRTLAEGERGPVLEGYMMGSAWPSKSPPPKREVFLAKLSPEGETHWVCRFGDALSRFDDLSAGEDGCWVYGCAFEQASTGRSRPLPLLAQIDAGGHANRYLSGGDLARWMGQLGVADPFYLWGDFCGAGMAGDAVLAMPYRDTSVGNEGRIFLASLTPGNSTAAAKPAILRNYSDEFTIAQGSKLSQYMLLVFCIAGVPYFVFRYWRVRALGTAGIEEAMRGSRLAGLGWFCLAFAFLPCMLLGISLQMEIAPEAVQNMTSDFDNISPVWLLVFIVLVPVFFLCPYLTLGAICISLYGSIAHRNATAGMAQWLIARLLLFLLIGALTYSLSFSESSEEYHPIRFVEELLLPFMRS